MDLSRTRRLAGAIVAAALATLALSAAGTAAHPATVQATTAQATTAQATTAQTTTAQATTAQTTTAQAATAQAATGAGPGCARSPRPGMTRCLIVASSHRAAGARARSGPRAAAGSADAGSAAAAATTCTAGPTPPPGYNPTQLQDAYQLPASTSGAGMLVAVVAPYDDPNAASDLCQYRAQFGLPACPATTTSPPNPTGGCFTEVNQLGQAVPAGGPPAANANWALQTSAQLDTISATCPNCRILLVETDSTSLIDVGTGVDTAVALGADVVTVGVATAETSADTGYDSTYFSHPGVVITAAAGDNGYGISYPAASPDVVSVGGTTLTPSGTSCAGGARGWCETVWNDLASSPPGGATGAGCSAYEPKPSWQSDTGCALRTDNDLSADADPSTGVAVYDSYGESGWQPGSGLGGTAVAAAIVAGAYALAGPSSGSPASYPYLYGNVASINDITSGTDLPAGATCSPAYLCTAGTGYDGPTGLGSPATPTALARTDGLAGVVHSAKFGKCLDNSGGSLANSNVVDISTCNARYDYQQWIVLPKGSIHLLSSSGTTLDWCLDVANSGTANDTPVNLDPCNASAAQQWRPEADGEIINPESGLCLTDPNGSLTDGTQIQIRTCGDYFSQQWALPDPRPSAAGEITAVDTGHCLDNYKGTLADSNLVDAYPCNGGTTQQWTAEPDGTIRIASTWCLDVYHSGDVSGTAVDIYNCNGSDSEQWQQLPDGTLVNPESGLCLTDPGTAAVQLRADTCTAAADQTWILPAATKPS
jgi:Ricin-type beta-trefoil lectin domain